MQQIYPPFFRTNSRQFRDLILQEILEEQTFGIVPGPCFHLLQGPFADYQALDLTGQPVELTN